ncbi:MAG: PAS domain S-box protein [Candidatus Marinimicrobia bacterium]|nr:PAS domain S-box protein [Candidatus Neomarinimicrobiota bacterium]
MTPTKYTELFKESADASLIIKNSRVIDCNDAAVRMLGYKTKSEILDSHPAELSPPLQADGSDSHKQADLMMLKARQIGNHRFEWQHIRANGEVFPVEVLLTAISTEGDGDYLHAIWRDITKTKQAERLQKATSELTEKLTTLMDMTSIGKVAAQSIRSFFESDAIAINYIDHKARINRGIYSEDTALGNEEPQEFEPLSSAFDILDSDSIAGSQNPKLINRTPEKFLKTPMDRPFGAVDRKSASLLFVPIVWGDTKVGEVTAQSYTFHKYTEESLAQLQIFANLIGGAFLRAITFEKLKQEQVDLRRNQFRLNLSQKLAHVGTWEYDPISDSSYWSEELYRMFQIDPGSQVKLEHMTDRIHPDDVELFKQEVKSHLSKRTDYRIILPGGEIRYMHEELADPEIQDGKPIWMRGSIQDVTEHTLNLQKIKESEARFRLFADYTHDWEYLRKPDGEYVYMSPACENITGYSIDEITSDPTLFLKMIREDYRESMFEHLNWEDEKHGEYPFFTKEFPIRHKDGTTRWLEHNCSPVFDAQGNFIGRRSNNRDINDRKQAEIALNQYKYIVSSTSDMLAFIDHNYTYLAANTAYVKAVNTTVEDIIGKSIGDVFGKSFFESVIKANIDRCLAGESVHYQTWVNYPAYGKRFVDTSYNAHFDSDQKLLGLVVSTRDITEMKRAEDERADLEKRLRQSQKLEAIGTMAGGIAHDFNNILQGFFLYAGIIKNQLPEEGELRSHFQQIIEAGDRAKELVRQILTFSRQEAVERKPIQIQYLIKDAIKLIRASTPSIIDIVDHIDTQCGYVKCDASQVHQLFVHLCNNATYAMHETGGMLKVELHEREVNGSIGPIDSLAAGNKYVELLVSDTGRGMDAETLEKIFDPFFSTKDVNEGTGLGLSIVHGIIHDMGGKIDIESEPGKGTSVRIFMPVEDIAATDSKENTEDQKSISGLRILYADDDKMISGAGKLILENLGNTVDVANDGRAALEMFQKDIHSYDLIITDLTMPRMTGLQLVKEVRKLSKTVCVLLTSGVVEADVLEDFKKQGIDRYLQKPWSQEILIQAVASLFDEGKSGENK